MMAKERRSSDYLFFRFPSHYALILAPMIAGVTNFFVNNNILNLTTETNLSNELRDQQYDSLTLYFSIAKLGLAIMCAFFITYRWTIINKDGSYGYFLTQGIDRSKFFMRSFIVFFSNGFLGIYAGFLILNFLGGINLPLSVFLRITLLSFSSSLLVVSLAILLGEALSIPELSSFILVLVFGMNATVNNNDSSIPYKIMNADLLFRDGNIIVPFTLSFFIGFGILIGSYIAHIKQDVEL